MKRAKMTLILIAVAAAPGAPQAGQNNDYESLYMKIFESNLKLHGQLNAKEFERNSVQAKFHTQTSAYLHHCQGFVNSKHNKSRVDSYLEGRLTSGPSSFASGIYTLPATDYDREIACKGWAQNQFQKIHCDNPMVLEDGLAPLSLDREISGKSIKFYNPSAQLRQAIESAQGKGKAHAIQASLMFNCKIVVEKPTGDNTRKKQSERSEVAIANWETLFAIPANIYFSNSFSSKRVGSKPGEYLTTTGRVVVDQETKNLFNVGQFHDIYLRIK